MATMNVRRGRRAVALAFLLGVQTGAWAQTAEDCRVKEGVVDIWGAATTIRPVAAGTAVAAVPDAVLALETLQIATRMWRTREALTLRGSGFTYPAGVRVTALMSPRGKERCLRDAMPPGAGPHRGEAVACLSDADGDGRFETVEMVNYNAFAPFVGTKPRFRPRQRFTLESPVSMEEDSGGIDSSRLRLHRRLRITDMGTDRADIVVEIATQNAPDLVSYPPHGGSPTPVAAGPIEFTVIGRPRSVALTDGATEQIGGMRFRVAKAGSTWALTPLDKAFPEWLTYRCGGTQVTARNLAS